MSTHSRKRVLVTAGDRYGRFTILAEAEGVRKANGAKVRTVLCRCDCGTQKVVRLCSLREGTTQSCGCFLSEIARTSLREKSVTHNSTRHPLYMTWANMKKRCEIRSSRDFKNYGERGISVCEEWRTDFLAFLRDVGERPAGMTLDRIDNSKGYEPGNVRWATRTQQMRNTRRTVHVEVRGEILPLPEACERLALPYKAAKSALAKHGTYGELRRTS